MVQAQTFDQALGEVVNPLPIGSEAAARLGAARPPSRRSDFTIPASGNAWPVLRLNALRVLRHPTSCRRLVCDIGGTSEVRRAIAEAGGHLLAQRRQDGVVGFGADREFHRIFDPYGIVTFDSAPLVPGSRASTDLALLYETLAAALARGRGLIHRPGRRQLLTVDPVSADDPRFAALRSVASRLTGTIPNSNLEWAEGVDLQLEWHAGQAWLIFDPIAWAERAHEGESELRLIWLKERTARRYNPAWNALFEAWARILSDPPALSCFGLADGEGLDATFELEATTGYSRPLA